MKEFNETYHQARQATGIAEKIIENENGDTFYVVKAYGVPIGTKEYIAHWLELKSKKIISNLRKISDILDPNAIVPAEIPIRQCLWLLILTWLQSKAITSCDIINQMTAKCLQIDFSTLIPCEWTHVVQYTVLEIPNLNRSRNVQIRH